jgi:hypothetical protein
VLEHEQGTGHTRRLRHTEYAVRATGLVKDFGDFRAVDDIGQPARGRAGGTGLDQRGQQTLLAVPGDWLPLPPDTVEKLQRHGHRFSIGIR